MAIFARPEHAHDCADIDNDLPRILNTIRYGTERDASVLDAELRRKYPAINAMQQAAYSLPRFHVGVLLESEVDLPIRKTYGSIIFDGLGVLTAGSLFELAKSVTPLIDTASGL